MAWDEEEDTTIYKVVINHEEQYSIWPAMERSAAWPTRRASRTRASESLTGWPMREW